MRAVRGWSRHRFGWSKHFPRLLLNRHAPEVHAACAVADEVKILSVARPDRTPFHGLVIRHFRWLTAARRNGPDVSLCRIPPSPIGDPIAVRRPVGLYRIFFCDLPPFPRDDIYCPDSAIRTASDGGVHGTFIRASDLLPVR